MYDGWNIKDVAHAEFDYDEIIEETELALLIDFGEHEVWIPKSQIVEIDETSKSIIMYEWLAKKKGLI